MDPISLVTIVVIVVGLAVSALRRLAYHQALVVLVLGVFGLQFLTSRIQGVVLSSPIAFDLAFFSAVPPPASSLYTIFTSMFIHANFLHVLFNMIALLFIGSILESRISSRRFVVLYFVTGVLATLVFLLANFDRVVFLVGASGAVSGVLGALARLYPYQRLVMFYGFIPIPTPAWLLVVIFLLLQVFISFTSASIAWEAHVGGAVAGYLLAPLVMRIPSEEAGAPREAVGVGALKDLATTRRAREVLTRLEGETQGEVQRAWLEAFAGAIRCPQCDGDVTLKRRTLTSDCGWTRRV